MNIVLTNDDGIDAEGLLALYRIFSKEHRVVVVAPEAERSAVGHGISLHQPLRVNQRCHPAGGEWYAVSGTPADCVKLGILALLDPRPDLVISGINAGLNHGAYMHYSGTVAAAREACVYGVPSIAVSMDGYPPTHFDEGAALTQTLVDRLAEMEMPANTFLNVNMPDLPRSRITGICFCSQDVLPPGDRVDMRNDPRGVAYYWYAYDNTHGDETGDTDRAMLRNGTVSITPVTCDGTHYGVLERLKQFTLDL